MKILTVYANDEIAYEFDRDVVLEDQQLAFLDKMDSDMGRSIKIRGQVIAGPDTRQKATFVAMNLIRALQQEDEAKVFALCAYLVNRLPGLVEVRANDHDDTITIDLVEEQ